MEVILLSKVENLGALGDKVTVKSGYARNYLIPQGKAKFATAENIAEFEARRAELEAQAASVLAEAEERKAKIEALSSHGHEVEKREIRMPDGAFRNIGEYQVEIHLHTDVNAMVNIHIVPEE